MGFIAVVLPIHDTMESLLCKVCTLKLDGFWVVIGDKAALAVGEIGCLSRAIPVACPAIFVYLICNKLPIAGPELAPGIRLLQQPVVRI